MTQCSDNKFGDKATDAIVTAGGVSAGLLAAGGAAVALKFPAAGAALAIAATFMDKAIPLLDKRTEKRLARLEAAIGNVYRRFEQADTNRLAPEIDHLFLEIAEAMIQDDEEQKRVFYEAALLWQMERKPTNAQVRAVRIGLRDLSFIEIVFFIRAATTGPDAGILGNELGEDLAWNHLVNAGFCEQSRNPKALRSLVGTVVMDFSDMTGIEETWRQYTLNREL